MIAPLQTAKEHFDKIKADYQSQVEKLTALVDGGVDTVDFLKVSGQSTSGCMSRLLRVLPEVRFLFIWLKQAHETPVSDHDHVFVMQFCGVMCHMQPCVLCNYLVICCHHHVIACRVTIM